MAITSRADIKKNMSNGSGFFTSLRPHSNASTTGANSSSGFLSINLFFNFLGTTAPNTLVGFQIPPSPSVSVFHTFSNCALNNGRGTYLARLYNFGTVALNATGDKFTADASVTFPVTRTQLGASAQALGLIPILYVTTAITTTQPVITLKTVAGGTGYVNQDGNNVVGSRQMTLPLAGVESAFIMRLEQDDSAVQKIAAVQVNTAASAGAARLFGAELIAPIAENSSNVNFANDSAFLTPAMVDMAPASATSGTLTSYLAIIAINNTGSGGGPCQTIMGVFNN